MGEHALQIGRHLSHYRIESRLGGGGMGEVFVAHDTTLDRKVALKVLASKRAGSEAHRARFEREARAVAAINHPNIVTIHSVEQAEGLHFLTMELIQGETLSELIPEDGLPVRRLLEIAIPLADAVGAAHRHGIVHRDLKPDNIMVDDQGRLKVLDFGLARLHVVGSDADSSGVTFAESEMTEEGSILGTAAYMSPEQAQGKTADERSDVFSLGIIMYQMVSGRRPFQGSSKVSVLFSIMNDTPPPLGEGYSDLPRHLVQIIDRCLSKDPDHRFQSALALRDALAELKTEIESGVAQGPVSSRRRARTAVWVALAVVVPVLLVGLLLAVGSGRRPGRGPGAARRSIAVLPFTNLSPDQENEYFSDGITEEITGKLARISDLEVASRSSVARFKGSRLDAREIGRDLGVEYLLEGSVRKAGAMVRISARLVSAENGFQLWSGDFEGQLDDVFGVQEKTALKIAEALDLHLSPGEHKALRRRHTTNPQAYDAYLRGRALVEYFNQPEMLESARQHFERALLLDPEYPLALVGLSRVESQFYRNIDPREERLDQAQKLAEQALAIDPEIAEAHLALGQVVANRYRYRQAAAHFREGIRLEPRNAYAWDLISWALAYQQPPDARAAEEAARIAISLQASLIGAYYHLGRALLLQERFDEAVDAFEQSKRLDPDFETGDFGLAQVAIARGEYARALDYLSRLRTLQSSPVVPVQRCIAQAALGEYERALQALEEALALGYRDLATLESSPHLETLRSEPRFAELLQHYGVR